MNNARYLTNNKSLIVFTWKINKLINTHYLDLITGVKLIGPLTISIKEIIVEKLSQKRNLCLWK